MNPYSKQKEYLAYAGANESMWTGADHFYYKRNYIGSTFKKVVLTLNTVCWMNPWALIENVPATQKYMKLFFYHVYGHNFRMSNYLNVGMATTLEEASLAANRRVHF
jgi:hypothetical protein